MQITYNPDLVRQNDGDQTVYFTLTDDQGNEYKWHCDCPKNIDIQKYLNSKMEKFLLLIRQREYPEAVPGRDYIVKDGMTDLSALEEWVKSDATIRNDDGEFVKKAEQVSWKSTHPIPERIIDGKKISSKTWTELDAMDVDQGLKDWIGKIFGRGK